jgi:hypothetical protein
MLSAELTRAIENLELDELYMSSIEAWRAADFSETKPLGIVLLRPRVESADVTAAANRNRSKVTLNFRVELREGATADKATLVAAVAASFVLNYREHQPGTVTNSALSEFANSNAVHNAWPYWRECAQAAFGRMGISGVVLPLFKLQRRNFKTTELGAPPPDS